MDVSEDEHRDEKAVGHVLVIERASAEEIAGREWIPARLRVGKRISGKLIISTRFQWIEANQLQLGPVVVTCMLATFWTHLTFSIWRTYDLGTR